MSAIHVIVADGQTLLRESISALLDGKNNIVVVAQPDNGHDLEKQILALRPQVVVIGVDLPGLGAFEVIRKVKAACVFIRFLIMAPRLDEDDLRIAIEVGAEGFILKTISSAHFLKAVLSVNRAEPYYEPETLKCLIQMQRANLQREPHKRLLTPRELEVLKMLAEGGSVKEIATSLTLSCKTIEAHKYNLMRKLRLHNRSQLSRYAFETGICKLTMHAERTIDPDDESRESEMQ